MAAGVKRSRDDDGILRDYIETVMYECLFSAQYTANRQILFRIEDIAMRMAPGSFASRFPEFKTTGLAYINECIMDWRARSDPSIGLFFESCDLTKTTSLVIQKNSIVVTIEEKTYRLVVKDSTWNDSIVAAIELLHYPLLIMERIQRNRCGQLLDLEKDGEFITKLIDEIDSETLLLKRRISTLLATKKKLKK